MSFKQLPPYRLMGATAFWCGLAVWPSMISSVFQFSAGRHAGSVLRSGLSWR